MKIFGAKIKGQIMQGNNEIFIFHHQMSALEFVLIETKATSFLYTSILGHYFLIFFASYLSWMSAKLKTSVNIMYMVEISNM